MPSLEEYLVDLGFRVDQNSLRKYGQALGKAGMLVDVFGNKSTKEFQKAAKAVVAFTVTANATLTAFIKKLADADLEVEKLARAMFTSKENALAFKSTIDALGVSIEDLYLSPELMRRFMELRNISVQLLPPEEFGKQMQFIRDITFEFQKFKLIAGFAMQRVGMEIVKNLVGNLEEFRKKFNSFNEKFIKNIGIWAKKIADIVTNFIKAQIELAKFGKKLLDIFMALPANVKLTTTAIAGLVAFLKFNPFTQWLIGLSTLLLLMEDFYTFQTGGKSLFEDVWKQLKLFDNSNLGKNAGELISQLDERIGRLVVSLKDLGQALLEFLGYDNFNDFVEKQLIGGLSALNVALEATISLAGDLATIFRELGEFLYKPKKFFGDIFDFFKQNKADAEQARKYFEQQQGQIKPQSFGGFLQSSNRTIRNNVNNSQNNTFYVYGSNDASTASAIQTKLSKNFIRNFQGVIV